MNHPSPKMNPVSTGWAKNLAIQPSRSSQNKTKRPPVSRASTAVAETYFAVLAVAPTTPATTPAETAAGAASGPKNRCRDPPKIM